MRSGTDNSGDSLNSSHVKRRPRTDPAADGANLNDHFMIIKRLGAKPSGYFMITEAFTRRRGSNSPPAGKSP
jgi:hypothetical protein